MFSHWVLDLIVHRPDLPVVPWSPTRVGLGLWNSIPATLIIEIAMYLIGTVLYVRATRARDRVGTYASWALAFLALGAWLFIPWAYWVDRHREPVTQA